MKNITEHKIFYEDSSKLREIPDESVDLVVTSPPYPMIKMWDNIFSIESPNGNIIFDTEDWENWRVQYAFQDIHKKFLYPIWLEVYRVLKHGGIACINIGDAVRSLANDFCMYANHSYIIKNFIYMNFHQLPSIIWRKPTNSPTKFMGSGTLPVNAYVTLEHEHILIFRKSHKRGFPTKKEKKIRNESAIFWEERNVWYSDLWQIVGIGQKIDSEREKSAAFPFEIAHRLINMYSIKGDTVLDPFLGTGTTSIAAITSERNSIGVEIDEDLRGIVHANMLDSVEKGNKYNERRIKQHEVFVKARPELFLGDYENKNYGFKVKTKPETNIILRVMEKVDVLEENKYEVNYYDERTRKTPILGLH